jgi:hypothetical protein
VKIAQISEMTEAMGLISAQWFRLEQIAGILGTGRNGVKSAWLYDSAQWVVLKGAKAQWANPHGKASEL